MKYSIIKYNSEQYPKMINLRYRILREPLGLTFTEKGLEQDKTDILCVGEDQNIVVACCILSPINEANMQLRQMAVDESYQGKAIGSELIQFAEKVAQEMSFTEIILHARKQAVGFYLKAGYNSVGDEFTEVGIPHLKMKKEISLIMENNNWEIEKKQVLDTVSKYADLRLIPFGKDERTVIDIEKRNPMYGGCGVVYMLSLFEKGELANNRIGVYMVLMNKGDEAGFHEHASKNEQELYVIVNGEGQYTERLGLENKTRTLALKKGNVTSIYGNDNYHAIINTGDEPLIVFVVSTYFPEK